jgi:thiol-disulfide isomerase/thioredoxin
MLSAKPAFGLLKVGDPAPPLKVTDWVKGKPFDIVKDGKDKVILIEFWATWCVPCIQIIPETNKLHRRYGDKGLVIIGATDSGQGQSLRAVQQFVAKQGHRMEYRIAFDNTQKSTEAYINATGAFGIPHAVVIGKDGRIAWIGHPADPEMKEAIQDLLLDRFDAARFQARAALNARMEPLLNDFYMAMNKSEWRRCLSLTEAMLAVDPANLDALRFRVIIYIEELEAASELRAWVDRFIGKHADNAEALAKLASLLISMPQMPDRQPDLALRTARLAYNADSKDVGVIQTLALVCFEIGDVDRAIEYQRKAVKAANVLEVDDARQYLEFYESCKKLHASASSK